MIPSPQTQPDLPARIKLLESKVFVKVNLEKMDLSGDTGKRSIRLRKKCVELSEQTAHNFRYIVLHALNGRRKISTVVRWINELDLFTRTLSQQFETPLDTITFQMFNHYTAQKKASQQKLLRSALLYWAKLELPGIATDLKDFLTTAASPRPRQTIEIQNSVPRERPFSQSQVRAILSAIDDLYIRQDLNCQDNLMWRLVISEALRPSQIRLLLIEDVRFEEDNNEQSRVMLKVPLVKQSGTAARDRMFESRLSEPVSRALRQHLFFLEERLGQLPAPSSPLFCWCQDAPSRRVLTAISIDDRINKTKRLICESLDDLGHQEIFTRRFKHTKLTHLAILGAPLPVLARAGYQTTTISLRHYTNLTDEAFAEYEVQMSEQHEEILGAFKGKIVERERATHQDLDHRIFSPDLENSVGACSETPCNAFAPIACYTCLRFEAFDDGAHDAVLRFLVERQALAASAELTPDATDRDAHLISAVKNVINEIRGGHADAE